VEMLVCVKRVPTVGGKIVLTPDGLGLDTRMSGFTISPHEECAVEEAVRIRERLGGRVTVLTLGPPEAADQVRDALALGAERGVLLEAGDREWGPVATAAAIADAARDGGYDLLLFGNEAADSGDYQVPVRVAHALGRPCVTGIKHLEVLDGGRIRAGREYLGIAETFEVPLPAVISVKEGINLPRYPSLPGRLRAKRAVIDHVTPSWRPDRVRTLGFRVPEGGRGRARVLGRGVEAVPALVELLDTIGVLP
jgi:electron transfer flavoprotein beta subunit